MSQTKKSNLLEELVKPRVVKKVDALADLPEAVKELRSSPFTQSNQPAEDPPVSEPLDTTTKAVSKQTIRRFDLNDMPSMGVKIYPHLKRLYPHLNDRMYTGWARGCIGDNSCHFVRTDRTVCLAFVTFKPINPVPFIDVKFLEGHPDDFGVLYDDLRSWGSSLGASHIEQEQYDPADLMKYLPGLRLEERVVGRVFLK